MRPTFAALLALASALPCLSAAEGDDEGESASTTSQTTTTTETVEDGHTLRDGLWWRAGKAYSRARYYQPGYWQGCYYYQPYYYYNYTPAAVVNKTVNNSQVTYNKDWRVTALEVAKLKLDQAYYAATVNALGLISPNGYNYNYGNSYQLGSYGANGNTVYGYSYESAAKLYGETDLNALYQAAARLTQNAQTLAGQANSDFSNLTQQAGSDMAKVAAILAAGEAAQRAASAIKAPNTATVTTRQQFTFEVGPDGQIMPVNPNQAQGQTDPGAYQNGGAGNGHAASSLVAWQANATQRCITCHAPGKNPKGGFDVTQYPRMTPEQKQKVWARLTTTDPTKSMPRLPDGGPGPRLTAAELKLWLSN
jgi:hypothetical protein